MQQEVRHCVRGGMLPVRYRRLWMFLVGATVAAALFVGCGSGGDDDAAVAAAVLTTGPRTSAVQNNKFETPMRIAVGSTVTWVNHDGVAHNVIADGSSFKSGKLDEGDSFAYEFTSAGRFAYLCTFHPGMKGVIQVE